MKDINCYWLLLVIALLSSCQAKKLEEARREIITFDGLPGDTLTMESVIDIPPIEGELIPELATPDLYLVDDTLIVLTQLTNASSLRFFNLAGELLGHSRLRKKADRYPLPVDRALRASFDLLHPNTNIYYEYVIEDGQLRLEEYTRMRLRENSPRHAARLDENRFVFIGEYKDGLFGIWDEPTRTLTFFGDYPIKEDYTTNLLLRYFSGRFARDDDQFVYVSYQFGFISSYKYNKGRLVKQWEKQIGEYLYRENSLELVFDPKHKNGFLEVQIVGDYIYTLYNGMDESAGEEFSNSIVIFTRDGKPVARYQLPDMMAYMKFDSKGEYAYATYSPVMGDVKVVRFRLPETK